MKISVAAIAFHPRGTSAWSIPIRQNEAVPISVPEWTRGSPGPSRAAYIRDQLPQFIPVVARFAIDQAGTFAAEIRAEVRDGDSAFAPQPRHVTFVNGDSGWQTFALETTAIRAGGVKRASVEWGWQYRTGADDWTGFDETQHQFYVLLSTPTAPWTVFPDSPLNLSLPWADLLDFACEFAKDSGNPVEAAGRITEAVFDLGEVGTLSYDAEVGAPHYTVLGVPLFLCSAFLERVRGEFGVGQLVNCSDCGTIVSTLANALGADLWQSKMGLIGPGFRLNPILAIGCHEWTIGHGGFAFHEVAWTGECLASNTVYDACLKTDADQNPTAAPQRPNLPVNQLFGPLGQAHTYRTQIAAPTDQLQCTPQPTLRTRRPVTARAALAGPPLPEGAQRSVEKRLAEPNLAADAAASRHFAMGFRFFGGEFQDWSLGQVRELQTISERYGRVPILWARVAAGSKVTMSWWHSTEDANVAVRIDSFETPSAREAAETLLRIVADIEIRELERLPSDGGAVYASANGAIGLLLRGNHVHALRPASKSHVDVIPLLRRLDEMLTSGGMPIGPEAALSAAGERSRALATGWLRLVVDGASVRQENGVTRVRAHGPGLARVSAFHVGPAGPNA